MDYFSRHIFSDPEKKNLNYYSLWFLQNLDETMTAGYFLGGGGGIFPPLTAVFPPSVIIALALFSKRYCSPKTPLPPVRTQYPYFLPPPSLSPGVEPHPAQAQHHVLRLLLYGLHGRPGRGSALPLQRRGEGHCTPFSFWPKTMDYSHS